MSEKTRVIGSAGGALGLGAFAAAIGACRGLPWAVALLGVSGAVALHAFPSCCLTLYLARERY